MSLIHQALKKAQGARRIAASGEYALERPGASPPGRLILPALFIISVMVISMSFIIALMKQKEEAIPPVVAVKALPSQTPAQAAHRDYNETGIEEYEAGRLEEAEALFTKALETERPSSRLYSNLGLTLMRLGKTSEAEGAFKKALELEPENPEALNNYGCLLAQTGRPKKAVQLLEKALKADPFYADARLNLGVMLEKKGDLEGAFSNYGEFMKSGPSDKDAALVREKLMALRSEIILKHSGGR